MILSVAIPERPETDEQIRTQSHNLPEDEEEHHAAGKHQSDHTSREKGDVGEETGIVWVLVRLTQVHIPLGINKNQHTYKGHHKEHSCREAIHLEPDLEHRCASRQPGD